MNEGATEPLDQLHKLLAELEGLAKSAAATAGQSGAEVADRLKGALSKARTRLRDAEQELERGVAQGAQATDEFVHEHTWMSIGIAAAVGFVIGVLLVRRD